MGEKFYVVWKRMFTRGSVTLVFIFCLLSCTVGVYRIPLERKVVEAPSEQTRSQSEEVRVFGNVAVSRLYYTTIYLGNQSFSVQIDTASVNLAIPSSKCHIYEHPTDSYALGKCPTANGYYDVDDADETACGNDCEICQNQKCWFSVEYADGSYIRGPLIRDQVTIGDLKVDMTFGAIERESPSFTIGYCDGILGMAFADLDQNDGSSLFGSLVASGEIEKDVFSLCFTDNGGELYLGGYNPALDTGPIARVSMQPPYDYYRVAMSGISIGGNMLPNVSALSFPETIIDSGTTMLELNDNVFQKFVASFQQLYPNLPYISTPLNIFSPGQFCFVGINLALFPTITFIIEDKQLDLGPDDYFIKGVNLGLQECYSLGITTSGGDLTVLGDVFMQAFYTIFDRQNHTIGFGVLENCEDSVFFSDLITANNMNVQVGDPIEIQVAVHYLITHQAVEGIIVEYATTRGTMNHNVIGKATDSRGISTVTDFVAIANGTIIVYAVIPGSLTPPLEIIIHATGPALASSALDYSTYYNPWKNENNHFIFGIPDWLVFGILAIVVLVVILIVATLATLAVRNCRDRRFQSDDTEDVDYSALSEIGKETDVEV